MNGKSIQRQVNPARVKDKAVSQNLREHKYLGSRKKSQQRPKRKERHVSKKRRSKIM